MRFYEDKGLIAPHRDGTTRLDTRRDVARLIAIVRAQLSERQPAKAASI